MAGRPSKAFNEGFKELMGMSYEEMSKYIEGGNRDLPIAGIENIETEIVEEPKHQPHLISFSAFPEMLEQDWEPTLLTGHVEVPDWLMPRAMTRKVLIHDYKDVRESPYDPNAWIGRAGTLLGMGYGELAAADAYKGWLLTENLVNRTVIKADGGNIFRKAFLAMPQTRHFIVSSRALLIQAWHDAAGVLEAALKEMPDNAVFPRLCAMVEKNMQSLQNRHRLNPRGMDEAAIARTVKRGCMRRVAYPWIVSDELTRGPNAIKNLKAKFKAASSNAVVASSSIGGVSKDNFGVFAKLDIHKGQRIMLDRSVFCDYNIPGGDYCGACCEPLGAEYVTVSCCQTRFCSEDCKGRALSSYHRMICGKDFTWMYDERKEVDYHNDTIPLVMLKILATAAQQKTKPLSLPCVATLNAGYGSDRISFFKLRDNIVTPIKILQTLGVDVFANSHFDSWVIQTLFLRIENNMGGATFGKRTAIGINPFFSMFNHDCNPSARWGSQNELLVAGGPIVVTALRDIKAKEEITVSYVERYLPENIRREKLKVQIGKICECDRCLRGRAGEKETDRDTMDMMMEGHDPADIEKALDMIGLGSGAGAGNIPDTKKLMELMGLDPASGSKPDLDSLMSMMGSGLGPVAPPYMASPTNKMRPGTSNPNMTKMMKIMGLASSLDSSSPPDMTKTMHSVGLVVSSGTGPRSDMTTMMGAGQGIGPKVRHDQDDGHDSL